MNKSYANVKTALPGPKAKELLRRRHDIVPDAVSDGVGTVVEKEGWAGPMAKKLLKRRHDMVPDAVSYGVPTFVDKSDGALLQDVEGHRFIDFAGAIGTINAGHRHPAVVKALHDQVDRYIHTGF